MGLFSKDKGAGGFLGPKVSSGGPLSYDCAEGTRELREFVTGSIINNNQRAIDRIVKYQLYWHFYNGQHWRAFNDTFLKFNYTKAFIDKVNTFMLGDKAFTIDVESDDGSVVDEKLEECVEGLLNLQWKKNNKVEKIYEIVQMGSVTGDAWVHLQWNVDKKFVQIDCLDSRHCFPEFENGDISKVSAFTLRQPLETNDEKYLVKCTRYTDEKIEIWFQRTTSAATDAVKMGRREMDNPYGFIPIVHIKNRPNSDGYWGVSDMRDIYSLNKVFNEQAQSIKNIIDYYSAPVTVVTGGTIKTLTRGMGKVWSGLPAEANVFNLGLGEDLNGAQQFLQFIKTSMHELSDVPENSLGKLQAISNTSAAALQVTYQPLIQQADVKAITYSNGIAQVNEYIIMILDIFDKKNDKLLELHKLAPNFINTHTAVPMFTYGLPQDRMMDVQQGQLELQMQTTSRKMLMNKLGYKNVPALMKEIKKEKMEDAQQEADAAGMMASATGGNIPPNPVGRPVGTGKKKDKELVDIS